MLVFKWLTSVRRKSSRYGPAMLSAAMGTSLPRTWMIAVEMSAFMPCLARWRRRASSTRCCSWTWGSGRRGQPAQTWPRFTGPGTSVALTTFSIKVITNLESPIQQWLLSQCLRVRGEPCNHILGTYPVIIVRLKGRTLQLHRQGSRACRTASHSKMAAMRGASWVMLAALTKAVMWSPLPPSSLMR